eukprot:COSAG02_NODE_3846_length_6153_cov_1.953089_8_plen_101_part_00
MARASGAAAMDKARSRHASAIGATPGNYVDTRSPLKTIAVVAMVCGVPLRAACARWVGEVPIAKLEQIVTTSTVVRCVIQTTFIPVCLLRAWHAPQTSCL